MRVRLDYLNDDTVLGHKIRCEILAQELRARGHEITDRDPHWLVVDYQSEFTAREHTAPTGAQRLLMGMLPQEPEDWAWHPLHLPQPRTLTGKEYLILDPSIKKLAERPTPKPKKLLISMGGYDGWKLTEKLIEGAGEKVSTVIIGPNFGRTIETSNINLVIASNHQSMLRLLGEHVYVICGWGQTVFEALALNCQVVPIVQSNEHADEASIYNIPYVTRANIAKVWSILDKYMAWPAMKPPLFGAERVVEFMENHCQY